jgi:hypothetical protein
MKDHSSRSRNDDAAGRLLEEALAKFSSYGTGEIQEHYWSVRFLKGMETSGASLVIVSSMQEAYILEGKVISNKLDRRHMRHRRNALNGELREIYATIKRQFGVLPTMIAIYRIKGRNGFEHTVVGKPIEDLLRL